jgi:hypothetical protein
MQTMKEPSRLAMCAAGRIVDMCERAFGVELPCAERGDELQRQFAEAIDAALNASPQIADETEQRATVIVRQRAYDVPKEVAESYKRLLTACRVAEKEIGRVSNGFTSPTEGTADYLQSVIAKA